MGATAAMFALNGAETYSQISQQRQQARALTTQGAFEGAAYDRNAKLATLQASDAVARGDINANIKGQQIRQEIGSTRASIGASGVVLDSGSALDVQTNEATLGALDIATIKNNAAREAWGYTTQAQDYTQRGRLARTAANNAAAGLQADEVSTLLTGVAKTYGIYRNRPTAVGGVPKR